MSIPTTGNKPAWMSAEIIRKAMEHLAEIRGDYERQHQREKAAERTAMLEAWRPHLEAIRKALPLELQNGLQEPTYNYSWRSGGDNPRWMYSPAEIKIGEISVFAYHYQAAGSKSAEVFFQPGHLALNDELEIYSSDGIYSRTSHDTNNMDFLHAVALAYEDFQQNHAELLRIQKAKTAARAAKPEPPPSIGEQLEELIRQIAREEVRGG